MKYKDFSLYPLKWRRSSLAAALQIKSVLAAVLAAAFGYFYATFVDHHSKAIMQLQLATPLPDCPCNEAASTSAFQLAFQSNDAAAGPIGTTRPTHYHILHDEIGFSADDMQELVHSLSYVCQRSTTAISVVAPVCYAHLAAAQMSQFIKFDELSETSSSRGGVPVPALPQLHEKVRGSMFFC